ncbi:MAG: permease prefix domain 1-containing protein [Aeromicrobium sp.]
MSAIDEYLDRLLADLHGSPKTVRRILTEAENHLREKAEALEREGSTPEDAECEAVSQFGSAEMVARAFGRIGVKDFVHPGLVLGAVGFLAIALSGLLAEAMGRIWGAGFVAGDLPGTTYTPARCSEFTEYFPGRSCLEAAAMHHWGEVVQYRVAAAVLGLACLAALRFVRRRTYLPATFVPIAGAALFGLAAIVLLGDALNSATQGGNGIGASLSAGIIAAFAAGHYTFSTWRAVRRPLVSR